MEKHVHSGGGGSHFRNLAGILTKAGIKKGDVLLDLGCGKGAFSLAASTLTGPTGKVYAMDIHEDSIKQLQKTIKEKNLTNIEPITADAVKPIPFPANSVDICLMSNVLHGFAANEELPAVMKNLEKVLKKDNRLAIIEFKKTLSPFGPPQNVRFSREDVENIFKKYGYDVIGDIKVGLFHYGIILGKKIER